MIVNTFEDARGGAKTSELHVITYPLRNSWCVLFVLKHTINARSLEVRVMIQTARRPGIFLRCHIIAHRINHLAQDRGSSSADHDIHT